MGNSEHLETQIDELERLIVQLERAHVLEAQFRAFADSARDYAFITLSLDKTVVGWNKGAELVLGYSGEEVLGRPGAIFFTPEDVELGGPDQETTTALLEGRRGRTLACAQRRDKVLGEQCTHADTQSLWANSRVRESGQGPHRRTQGSGRFAHP